MDKVMYRVLFGVVDRIHVVKQTPKGVKTDEGKVFHDGQLHHPSSCISEKYNTERIVSSKARSFSIAEDQRQDMIDCLRYKSDDVYKKDTIGKGW